jgi:uncharacterized protein (DUF58 family)
MSTAVSNGIQLSLDELVLLRAKAQGLSLKNRQKVASMLAGSYQSGLHGRGVDFVETRHYQAGDDIRSIDWRVTARSGHTHTKVFQEERERPVHFLVDFSPSMYFATRVALKSVLAARSAATLAWAARLQGERVGGIVCTAERFWETRPLGGRRGVARFLDTLVKAHQPDKKNLIPAERNTLTDALIRLRHVASSGSLVCVFSDFLQLDNEAVRQLQQLGQHTDILGFSIYDPLEETLPTAGQYHFSDGEEMCHINSGDKPLRQQHTQDFQQRKAQLKQHFHRRGMRLWSLSTAQTLEDILARPSVLDPY